MRLHIIKRRKPADHDIDSEFEWICSSLGLCDLRDKDKTSQALLNILLRGQGSNGLRSDELSDKVGKSRGAIVNHLNKLMDSGLVIRRNNRYELREKTLSNTLHEMQADMLRLMHDMEEIAEKIDKSIRYGEGF